LAGGQLQGADIILRGDSAAKARVGVARKLAVILLRLWTDNSVFQPRANAAAG
jgi:hypothetical protein